MKRGLWCDMMIWCVVFCRVWDLVWLWGLLLSSAECYTRLTQIPKMGMWSCICCVVYWAVVVWVDWLTMWKSGTCTVIYSDMITLYGFCLLWDVWLSGLWWSGLILYSRLYLGKLWECLFLWLSVWKLCRTLFSDICCWSCMVLWLCGLSGLCVLLLIYPSVLV